MLDGTADGQAVVAHVDEAGDGTGEGSLTQQADEVGDEVVCKLLRRDDIGTALDVDHFILGDGSIGKCSEVELVYSMAGKLLSYIRTAGKRIIN